jgi:hypothetical protein
MGSLSNQDLFRSIATRFEKDPGIPVQSPTESFWQIPPCTVANTQSENLPAKVDVAIIGSGISTISTAQHLLHLQPDLSITLLEARTAISGATGRNGGHIMTSPWYFYESSKHENGKERATRLATFQTSHIQAMVDEAKALGVEGEAGQVRQVRILTMVHDQEVWTSVKRRLQAYLDDFPSERDRYKVYEDRASLEVNNQSLPQPSRIIS